MRRPLYRKTPRLALIAIVLLATVVSARADERLDLYPQLSFSEILTDNLPESTVPPNVSHPVLIPIPPGVSPPPVNSYPYQPKPTTKGSHDDAISMAVGGATVDFTGPSRIIELTYLTDGEVYTQNSRFDRAFQDHYVGFKDTERLGQTTQLWLGDTFIKGQPIFGQALIGSSATSPLVSEALLQNNYTTNEFHANLNHQFSPRLTLTTTATQGYFHTSSGSTTDSFRQGGATTLYYSLTRDFSLGPAYHFTDMRFSGQPRLDVHEPGLSAQWYPSPQWLLSGQAGPLFLNSSSGTKADFGYRIAVTYLLQRAEFRFSSARSPSLTAGLAGGGVGESVRGSAGYQLAQRTSVYAWISYFQVSGSGTNQHLTSFGCGLSRQLNENVSLFVQYLGFQSNASTTSRKSLANSIFIGVRLSTAPWFWKF